MKSSDARQRSPLRVPVHRQLARLRSFNRLTPLIEAVRAGAAAVFTVPDARFQRWTRRRAKPVRWGASVSSMLRRWLALTAGTLAAAAMLLTGPPAAAQSGGAQFVYDPAGRLIEVIGANGASAQYTYDPAGNLLSVTPLSSTTNVVTGFSEVSGPVGGTLTIYGSGFSTTCSNNVVHINGIAPSVVSCTANSLTVTIPSGATTGTVTVTDSNGTVSSTQNFVVSSALQAPAISSFTPQIGNPGTSVTVSGSNFQASTSNETAYLNTTPSTITSTSAAAFTLTVPSGATPGPITVNTPSGSATSTGFFFALPAGVPASSVASAGPIAIDGPAQTVTIATSGQFGLLAFSGNAGQTVSLETSNQTFQSACVLGQIALYAPGNYTSPLGTSNFCTQATAGPLPRTGAYTLALIPANGTDTGSIRVQLQSAPPAAATITIGGSPVTVTTTVPGQQSQLTFTTTTANQVVSLQLVSGTYPTSCQNFSLFVSGPAPSNITAQISNPCWPQLLTAPVPGIYTLTMIPINGNVTVGSATFQLQNASPVTASATIGGSAVTLTTTVPAQQSQLSFTTTTANQVVSLEVVGNTYSTACGNLLLSVSGVELPITASLCPAAQLITLPTAGTYTATIAPNNTAAVGSLTLQLWNAPPVTGSATIGGSAVTLTTTAPAQISVLTFTTSTANQVVTANVSGITYPGSDCAYDEWTLYGPAPSYPQLATGTLCEVGGTGTFPTPGTYAIVVVPYGTDTGSITYQLQ